MRFFIAVKNVAEQLDLILLGLNEAEAVAKQKIKVARSTIYTILTLLYYLVRILT